MRRRVSARPSGPPCPRPAGTNRTPRSRIRGAYGTGRWTLVKTRYAFTADSYTSVVPQVAQAAAEATVAVIPRRRRSARSAW